MPVFMTAYSHISFSLIWNVCPPMIESTSFIQSSFGGHLSCPHSFVNVWRVAVHSFLHIYFHIFISATLGQISKSVDKMNM